MISNTIHSPSGSSQNLASIKSPFAMLKTKATADEILAGITHLNVNQIESTRTLLSVSIAMQRFDVAMILLEKGARLDLDQEEFDPLKLLMEKDKQDHTLLWRILEIQSDLVNKPYRNPSSWTPLGLMLGFAEADLIKKVMPAIDASIVEEGIEIDGRSAIHLLAERGMEDELLFLLEKRDSIQKANVNIQTEDGVSPLHLAVENGNKGCVELLLARGADVNAKSKLTEQTPLHIAANDGNQEILACLLRKRENQPKANIDEFAAGFTPLYLAAKNGHKGCVELLVENGGNYRLKNGPEQLCAAEIANRNKNHRDIVTYLRNKSLFELSS